MTENKAAPVSCRQCRRLHPDHATTVATGRKPDTPLRYIKLIHAAETTGSLTEAAKLLTVCRNVSLA